MKSTHQQVIFFSLLLFASALGECTEDWQCGNPVFFDCKPQYDCSVLPGVATATGEVFWLERCGSTVYVVRSDAQGTERIITVPEYNDRDQSAVVTRIVSANDETIYVMKKLRVYAQVTGFSKTATGYSEEFNVFSPREDAFDLAFNEADRRSYLCWRPYWMVIQRYETLNVSTYTPNTNVYQQTTCRSLSIYNSEIFWHTVTTYDNTTLFYRGTESCQTCSPPAFFVEIPGFTSDFQVYNGVLYFAQPDGIKSFALNNPGSTQTVLAGVNANAISIRNGVIFYNDGFAIRAVYVDGSGDVSVSVPSNFENVCTCTGGFSGPSCDQCPEGSFQWEEGVPSCVPYDISGFPVSCSADYHCQNLPFTRCTNRKCECVSGGIPPTCDECVFGGIQWIEGVPTCVA